MLYKVTVGRDVYVGTPEEILGFMARAEGAPASPSPAAAPSRPSASPAPAGAAAVPGASDPAGGLRAYMDGVAARLATHGKRVAVDVSSPLAFLESLASARLVRLERRKLPREDRVDPKAYLGDQPLAFGPDVDEAALRRDLFDED